MNNNLNNIKLEDQIKIVLEQYKNIINKKSKNKKYIFIYGLYRFECKFKKDNINIHIFSLKNRNNNILFDINFDKNNAEIQDVNKNLNNLLNTNYNPKNLIKIIIKICKMLNLNHIILTDNSYFLCNGKKINLADFMMLKDNKTWYQKYFNFELLTTNISNSNISKYNNMLHILSTLTIQDIIYKIQEFDYLLLLKKNYNNNMNTNILVSDFLQQKLNKNQCRALFDKDLINKIFDNFGFLKLYGKKFKLNL